MSCSRGPEECLGPRPSWDRHTADRTRYFLRWGGWELLLLVGAGVTPESLGAGLCFSSLAAGQDREGWCPSRACTTLMAPTVRMSPQSRVGASRGDSCLRTQCRAWVRMLLELRARGGLLSWRPNCLSNMSSVGSPSDTDGKNSSTHWRRHHWLQQEGAFRRHLSTAPRHAASAPALPLFSRL